MLVTRRSLLLELRDVSNEEAWKRFFDLYSPLIVGFARQQGCPHDLACDILQETMVRLMRAMPSFSHDPARGQFRSYLLKVVHNLIRDAAKRRHRYCAIETGMNDHHHVDQIEDEKIAAPGLSWDDMWDRQLLMHAISRVRDRLNTRTWQSFEMSVLQNRPVKEVEAALGIKANAIYQHRARIIALLQREVGLIKKEMGE